MRGLTAVVSCAVLSAGCVLLGPDYEDPAPPLATDWRAREDGRLDTTSPVAIEWWRLAFQDAVLDQLVATAVSANLSLRAAGLRVLQGRQQLAIAIGNQYPQQQDISASAQTERGNRQTDERYDLGVNLSWEVDVWGRFRRQIESASAQLQADVADYDGVLISLIADVAQTYVLIRTTQRRLAVARENVGLQRESVRITEAKHDNGETSALDVEQARSLLYNTVASTAALELSLQQFKNALAVLLGRPPQDLSALLGPPLPIPRVTPEIAVGMPQDLLRRRPDIRVAERQLAAQSARIGVAISDLYPHFGLAGAIGSTVDTAEGQDLGDGFSNDTSRYRLSAGFRWDVLNYGRLRSNVRLQDAVFQELLEDYGQTVLQAQAEAENAIVAYLTSQQQLRALQAAADAARRATDIATLQYQDGLVNFNTVITTLEALASQQDQLASSRGAVAANLVAVYRAIGGGWQIRQGEDPARLVPAEIRRQMRRRTKYWQHALPQ